MTKQHMTKAPNTPKAPGMLFGAFYALWCVVSHHAFGAIDIASPILNPCMSCNTMKSDKCADIRHKKHWRWCKICWHHMDPISLYHPPNNGLQNCLMTRQKVVHPDHLSLCPGCLWSREKQEAKWAESAHRNAFLLLSLSNIIKNKSKQLFKHQLESHTTAAY